MALPPGEFIMGRGSGCHIVIDDLLASREHARLIVTDDAVVVDDLGSTNGVYVNERRIVSPTPVSHGDRIVVGTQELQLRSTMTPPANPEATDFKDLAMITPTRKARSSSTNLLIMDEPGVEPLQGIKQLPPTEKADVVTTLGRLADRMLTMGRYDAAERVLSSQLHEVLKGARAGAQVPTDVHEAVVEYGLRLAEVTLKASWVNFVVEIHQLAPRIMTGLVITRVDALLQSTGMEIDRELFFYYQQSLRNQRDGLSLEDRILCDRILDLKLPTS